MRPLLPIPPISEGLPPPPPYPPLLVPSPAAASSSNYFNAQQRVPQMFSSHALASMAAASFNMTQSPSHNFPPPFFAAPAKPAAPPPTSTDAAPSLPTVQRGPTVYLGHLPSEVDDLVIRQMLQECGRVIRWSRTTDPVTRKLSSFGFSEFESPLGVVRAVRALNGLVLDGHELVANCEDKLKDGLEQWRRDHKLKMQEEYPSKSVQEIDADIEREEVRIQQVTQKIAQDCNTKLAAARQQAGLDSDRAPITEETKREQRRRRWLETMVGYVEVTPHMSSSMSSATAARIRLWNGRLKEARADFRKRLQAWERKELSWSRERKKRREETEMFIRNPSAILSHSHRNRLIELDLRDHLYYLSQDGSVWEGELSGRRQEDRSQRLKLEREWDTQDKKDEETAITEEREKREQEESQKVKQREEEERLRQEAEAIKDDTTADGLSIPSGPIKISMSKRIEPMTSDSLNTAAASAPMSGLFAAQEDDDDEDFTGSGRRALAKLDLPPVSKAVREKESHKLLMNIAAKVPKAQEELFQYPIDWAILTSNGIFEQKVSPWIAKKVTEFLGEEEPELTAFISTKLALGPSPTNLIEELKEFLDEDAENFIVKLWKLLVFEALRLTQN